MQVKLHKWRRYTCGCMLSYIKFFFQVANDMGLVRKIKSTRTRWLLLIKLFLVVLMIIFISYILRSGIVYDPVFQGNLTIANEATVSFRAETKANSKNIGINPNISGYIFHNHRLRLWYEGRCIDSSDGEKLTIQFCDPDFQQVRLGGNLCFL